MGIARILLVLSVFSFAACATFRPVAPERQRVFAGETSAIALAQPPPGGTTLVWQTGDGAAPFEGPVLQHAWQRPGVYTVVVEGSGGRDEFEVEVEPRPVLRAIPATATGVAFPHAWSRLPAYADSIARYLPVTGAAETVGQLLVKLGADPSRPSELVELGIDPAEGIAFVNFDFDKGTSWILVGILDEEKALATLRRVLGLRSSFRVSRVGGDLYEGTSGSGDKHIFGVAGGYLAIRGSDALSRLLAAPRETDDAPVSNVFAPPEFLKLVEERTAPELKQAMEAFAAAGAGLAGAEDFLAARAMAPGDDAVLFVRGPADPGSAPLPIAVGIELDETALVANVGIAMPNQDLAAYARAFSARNEPSAALGRYPGNPMAFASFSFDPREMLTAFLPDPAQQAQLAAAHAAVYGVPFERLLGSLTGNVSAAFYLDPEALPQIVAGLVGRFRDGAPGYMPPLIARVELQGEGAEEVAERVLAVIAQLAGKGPAGEKVFAMTNAVIAQPEREGGWQSSPTLLRVGDGVVEIRTAGVPEQDGTKDFSAVLSGEDAAYTVFLDVAGVLASVREANFGSVEAASVRNAFLDDAAFLAPLRSVSLQGRVVPAGIAGTLRVDLEPQP